MKSPLKKLREHYKLSQRQLALIAGCTQSTIWRWETRPETLGELKLEGIKILLKERERKRKSDDIHK